VIYTTDDGSDHFSQHLCKGNTRALFRRSGRSLTTGRKAQKSDSEWRYHCQIVVRGLTGRGRERGRGKRGAFRARSRRKKHRTLSPVGLRLEAGGPICPKPISGLAYHHPFLVKDTLTPSTMTGDWYCTIYLCFQSDGP